MLDATFLGSCAVLIALGFVAWVYIRLTKGTEGPTDGQAIAPQAPTMSMNSAPLGQERSLA
jgi:hypothetical protein